MGLKPCIVVFIINLFRQITAQNDQCPAGIELQVRPDADVKFSVILTIRESADGLTCGPRVSPEAVVNLAVLEWTVERLNADNFLDGVTIGFDVYDDCGISRKGMMHGLGVADSPILGSKDCKNGTVCQIGIIGTSNSDTSNALIYALKGSGVPILSPFATYPALIEYPDYYRTIPTDEEQIQGIAKLLQGLNLTYVAVVTTDDTHGQFAGERLRQVAKGLGVCVDTLQTVKTGKDLDRSKILEQRDRAKNRKLRVIFFGRRAVANAMFTELKFNPLTNVSWIMCEYLEDMDNYLTDLSDLENGTIIVRQPPLNISSVYEHISLKWANAIATSQSSDDIEKLMLKASNQHVPSFDTTKTAHVIDAVFIFAAAIQRRIPLSCPLSKTLCDELRTTFEFSINELKFHPIRYSGYGENLTIHEFNVTNRIVDFNAGREVRLTTQPELSLFDTYVVDGTAMHKIASFINGEVLIAQTDHLTIPTSMCNDSCPACVNTPEVSFAYQDGDSLILAIVSVHEVDPTNYFKCGVLRTSQEDVINVENIFHTVQRMRNATGINFGAIVIDDCYSSSRTGLIVSEIFAGKVKLSKPDSGDIIDVTKILAVITTTGSTVSITVARLMMELNIPVIASAASSPDLDDRVNFPYFLRTVPSDVEQARAMVDIIKRVNWKYVSVLYVKNNYGSKGKQAFVDIAKSSGICIAEKAEGISDNDTVSDLKAVFYRLSNQKSDVVVYFGTETLITRFLKVVDEANDFIFLASEDWGDNQYILENGGRRTLGSITLKNEVTDISGGTFKQYLQTIRPEENTGNPWFVEYWEDLFQCDLTTSFYNRHNKVCGADLGFSDELLEEIIRDQRIVHTADAVKVIAKSLKTAKDDYCKLEETFPCSKYFQYIDIVVDTIRTQTLDRGGKEVPVFKPDGNGNIGFEIQNVQEQESGELDYVEVGSYDEGVLILDSNNLNFYHPGLDGQCSGSVCGHCQFNNTTEPVTKSTTTHAHPVQEQFGTPDYTIIGILGFLLLVILIVCIIFFCYFRKRLRELDHQLKKTTFELRTSERIHNGPAFTNYSSGSMAMISPNGGPSGGTMYEFNKANAYLNSERTPNGVVNNGFVGSDMYLHARGEHEDENQNISNSSSPRGNSSPPKSPAKRNHRDPNGYRPSSKSSYGISTHHSFKKPADYQVKAQPRTQLAVPPCRPELPPRDNAHAHIPDGYPENYHNLPAAVPKEKSRKVRNNPKRTMSPHAVTRSLSSGSAQYKNPDLGDNFRPPPPQYTQGSKAGGGEQLPETGLINMAGSMEKISRV